LTAETTRLSNPDRDQCLSIFTSVITWRVAFAVTSL